MIRLKRLVPVSIALLVGVTAGAAVSLAAKRDSKVTLNMSEARRVALRAYPGQIMKEELEREPGGSGLRYSFDIRLGQSWREVGVDAISGRILENSRERANPKD